MPRHGGQGPARASYTRTANAIATADRDLSQDINPELLLATFLPVLLFAGAFNLEWHLVRRLKWSGLLLAGAHLLHACEALSRTQNDHLNPADPGPVCDVWVHH